jgi:hypothetical protein
MIKAGGREYRYEPDDVIRIHDGFCKSLGIDLDSKDGVRCGDIIAPLVMVLAFAISRSAPTEERAKDMLESVVRQMAHLMLAMHEARHEMGTYTTEELH